MISVVVEKETNKHWGIVFTNHRLGGLLRVGLLRVGLRLLQTDVRQRSATFFACNCLFAYVGGGAQARGGQEGPAALPESGVDAPRAGSVVGPAWQVARAITVDEAAQHASDAWLARRRLEHDGPLHVDQQDAHALRCRHGLQRLQLPIGAKDLWELAQLAGHGRHGNVHSAAIQIIHRRIADRLPRLTAHCEKTTTNNQT